MYTLKGEIKAIGEINQVSDSFKKREFVVTDASGQYAQHISLQLTQDRCELLDNFKAGDNVEVTFFLRGREWTNPKDGAVRYFNSLDAWKIDTLDTATDKPATADNAETFVAEGDDDLPF